MRSPSILSDCNVRPSFLRTTPAKKPRTEGRCQPVVFMIAAIAVPLCWLSSARPVACLEFERGVTARTVVVRRAFSAGRLAAERGLRPVLLLGMLGSFLQ